MGSGEVMVESTPIDGLLVVRLKQVDDERGTVREFFRASQWEHDRLTGCLEGPWAQVNVTESGRGVIRGLHGEAMNKLVGVVSGSALGAYLDARAGSATYGVVHTVSLEKGTQFFVPKGGVQRVSGPLGRDAVPLLLR